MLDLLVRGGRLVDGTGAPARHGRRRRPRRARGRGRYRRRTRGAHHRRRRPGRESRLRRHAHALRRPGAVGPGGHPVAVARRHHRDRRQLRVLDRAARARARRLRDAHDGAGRGHAARRARGRPGVGLAHLRRVARPARRPPGRERRLPRRPLDHAAGRDGRRRHDRDRHPGSDRGDGAAAARVARRRCARLLVVAGRGPHRRRRPAGAVTRGRVRGVPRPRRRGARPRGHDARVHRRDGRDPVGPHRADGRHVAGRRPSAQLEPARQPLADRGLRAAAHLVRPRRDEGRHGRRARAPRPPAHAQRWHPPLAPGLGRGRSRSPTTSGGARCATPRCASGCGPGSTPRANAGRAR